MQPSMYYYISVDVKQSVLILRAGFFPNHCLLVAIQCRAAIVTQIVWHFTAVNVLEIIGDFINCTIMMLRNQLNMNNGGN